MNERSVQDILEWIVLGLLAAVALLVVLWLGGGVFVFLGNLLSGMASLIWTLLKLLIPLLVVVAAAYFIVRMVQKPKTNG